jgi:hypothetical protein
MTSVCLCGRGTNEREEEKKKKSQKKEDREEDKCTHRKQESHHKRKRTRACLLLLFDLSFVCAGLFFLALTAPSFLPSFLPASPSPAPPGIRIVKSFLPMASSFYLPRQLLQQTFHSFLLLLFRHRYRLLPARKRLLCRCLLFLQKQNLGTWICSEWIYSESLFFCQIGLAQIGLAQKGLAQNGFAQNGFTQKVIIQNHPSLGVVDG